MDTGIPGQYEPLVKVKCFHTCLQGRSMMNWKRCQALILADLGPCCEARTGRYMSTGQLGTHYLIYQMPRALFCDKDKTNTGHDGRKLLPYLIDTLALRNNYSKI